MSVSVNAGAASQAISRALPETRAAPERSGAQAASAPDREVNLSRELEERLNGDIARIRKRIALDAPPPSPSPEGIGWVLDIRA